MKTIKVSDNWKFFAQGNANILLESPHKYSGKLLRLKKKGPPSTQIFQFYEQKVVPLIGNFVAKLELVRLESQFAAYANLICEEHSRGPIAGQEVSAQIYPDFISDKEYGLLIERVGHDSTENGPSSLATTATTTTIKSADSQEGAGGGLGAVLHKTVYQMNDSRDPVTLYSNYILEFKPKWLAPSPNAPGDAVRCRNCALGLYRTGKEPAFCRADLTSSNYNLRFQAIKCIFGSFTADESRSEGVVSSITTAEAALLTELTAQFLDQCDILNQLKTVQARDTRGILDYGPDEELGDEFLMAMTFRDATILLEIAHYDSSMTETQSSANNNNDSGKDTEKTESGYLTLDRGGDKYYVRAKLVDLDMKQASRRDRWAKTERELLKYYK
ncbi:hypothetical protein AWJ20_466 [Sugiyamaella lignohabitans]|uniref:Inositol-pentakisphosphate 2-kinase n=1 Tax=Sugiyamaella lignohabitans TaxID=796027 RepID=A0A161HKI3_9ASCO|nr:uncharacterized protein AWJ20_466 [Sugiyamaella lignohabitans]ANB12218.1 hypothetical protein AWJ20_466 [Sugiyamaella lignohabitans]